MTRRKWLVPRGTEHQQEQLSFFLDDVGLDESDIEVPDRENGVQVGFYVTPETIELLDQCAKAVGIRGRGSYARLVVLGYLMNHELPKPPPIRKPKKGRRLR